MAITASDFNSTRVPGTCKPTNFPTLEKFKELQRQLNRVAKVKKLSPIAVDGDIGPGTVSLFNKVVGASVNCSALAVIAEAQAQMFKTLADQAGAPANVATPKPASTPSIVAPTGALVPQPASASMLDSFKSIGLSNTHLMVLAGVGGLIAFKVMKKKRGRR